MPFQSFATDDLRIPKPLSPLEAAKDAMGLKAAGINVQKGQLDLQTSQREAQEAQAIQQAAAKFGSDHAKMLEELRRVSPSAAMKFDQAWTAKKKADIENLDSKNKLFADAMRRSTDANAYEAQLANLEQVFGPEVRQQLGPYDPNRVAQLVQDSMSTAEKLQAERLKFEQSQSATKSQFDMATLAAQSGRDAETARANKAREAEAAKPKTDQSLSEVELAVKAAAGDPQAKIALGLLREQKPSAAAGQRPITQTAEARLIDQQAKNWITATKPAVELDRQVKLLDAGLAAARRGDMAQGAQAILVTFQKILDPPSVVRESEFMRSAAGQSLINRVKGYVEQLKIGGAGVSMAELEKFGRLAKEAAQSQSSGYLDSEKKRIGKVLDRYEIPHELVFQDFEFSGGSGGSSGATEFQGAPPVGTVRGGYKFKGGDPNKQENWVK